MLTVPNKIKNFRTDKGILMTLVEYIKYGTGALISHKNKELFLKFVPILDSKDGSL